MLFDLCLELGYPHPDHLLNELSGRQLREWEVYYHTKPFGSQLGFYQSGIIASVLANVNRDSKKSPTPFKAEDFMPMAYRMDKPKKQGVELMKALLDGISVKKGKANG
jgi:hypothetical protein